MNLKKAGAFIKELRKESGLTQEQLAEHLNVSGRTVSRWETGYNMPDLDVLIEMAEFYKVDIRELIDGERKKEKMNSEMEETVIKIAEYTNDEKNRLMKKLHVFSWIGVLSFILYLILDSMEIYENMASLCLGLAFGMMLIAVIYTSHYIGKFKASKTRLFEHKHEEI